MKRREALEYLSRVRPALIPVAAPWPDICCESCRSGVGVGHSRCSQCYQHDVPTVLPISMSVHGSPLHHRLRGYKDAPSSEARREHALVLAALLRLFLRRHRDCLGDTPDFVVTVPSKKRDALATVVKMLPKLNAKHTRALKATGTSSVPRYKLVASQVEGRSVLLLDDTFTSGRSIAAAHSALVEGGAEILGPLVIGRHFRPDYWANERLWNCLKGRKWSLDECGLCGPVDCRDESRPQAMF